MKRLGDHDRSQRAAREGPGGCSGLQVQRTDATRRVDCDFDPTACDGATAQCGAGPCYAQCSTESFPTPAGCESACACTERG